MKIRLSAFVFLFVLSCILLTGCNTRQEKTMTFEFSEKNYLKVEGFDFDNDTPLSELLTTEYALSDLREFFGENIFEGDRILSLDNCETLPVPRTWDEVNQYFPVQSLRFYGNLHYSVYRVKNGGYFYVFWQVPIVSPNYMQNMSGNRECEIKTRTWTYIDRLPTIFSFWSIIKGHSTAKDVKRIDPCMELDMLSSSARSYSRLQSGKILIIHYNNQVVQNTDDLIVNRIEISSDIYNAGCLATIHANDLP